MLYYVTLDGREFCLSSSRLESGGPFRLSGSDGDLEVEVLRRPERDRPGLVLVGGTVYRVGAVAASGSAGREGGPSTIRLVLNGQPVAVAIETELERRARPDRNTSRTAAGPIRAPMPGRIVKVNVRAGDIVVAGDPLLGIEAMKMENEILAPAPGKVARVAVQVGVAVEADQELVVIE